MYDLQRHLQNEPAPATPHVDRTPIELLLRELSRAGFEHASDEDGRRLERCAELGLLDLAALASAGAATDPARACGDPLYYEVLAALAGRDFGLARLVAAHHTAALFGGFQATQRCFCPVSPLGGTSTLTAAIVDVPVSWIERVLVPDGAQWRWLSGAELSAAVEPLPGWEPLPMAHWRGQAPADAPLAQAPLAALLRVKESLDFITLTCGRLREGQRLARAFTEQRVLFRRALSDNPYVRTWQADHERRLVTLEAVRRLVAEALAQGCAQPDLPLLRYYTASRGLALASDLMQMCGGTGYMRESHMPDVYTSVVALIETYRPELDLTDDSLAEAWRRPTRRSVPAQAGQLNLDRPQAYGIRAGERRQLDALLEGFTTSLVRQESEP